MADYKKMYEVLFNEISNVIEILKNVQCKTEEIYISSNEKILPFGENEKE